MEPLAIGARVHGEGGDDAIKCPRSLVSAHFPASILQWLRGFDARAKQDFASRLADALYESFVEKLEAAAQVAQVGGAVMEARPEPGEGDLAVHIAKFCGEERLKDHAVGALAHPAAQPGFSGFALVWFGVGQFQHCSNGGNAQAFIDAQGGEAQEGER